ncbi:MAG: hypothetical protein UGE22_05025 [Clostridia bacterium]|nr:hypothetical protein [Clostridia bacterium]
MNCINLVKQRLLTVQTPEMTRATQAFLSSMSKYHVSLGPWSVGIDKESSDILFSVPADSLKFVSGNFLKSLRCSWIESGFTIVEEAEVVGYKVNNSIAYSHIFRLSPAA